MSAPETKNNTKIIMALSAIKTLSPETILATLAERDARIDELLTEITKLHDVAGIKDATIEELKSALNEAADEIDMYADFRSKRLSDEERALGGVDGLTPRTTPQSERFRAIAKDTK